MRSIFKFVIYNLFRSISRFPILSNTIVVWGGGAFGKSVHARANYEFLKYLYPGRKVVLATAVHYGETKFWDKVKDYFVLHFAKCIVTDNGLPFSVHLGNKIVIQTWHAPALKGIGLKDKLYQARPALAIKQSARQWADTDVVIYSGLAVEKNMRESFALSPDQLRKAFPPYYLKVCATANSNKVKNLNSFQILYLPTYRDWLDTVREWDLLHNLEFLNFVRENNVRVYYKYHPLDYYTNIKHLNPTQFVPISNNEDYLDYMFSSDVVVTDYSSVLYETFLLNKNVMIFAEDEVQYRTRRGICDDDTFGRLPRYSVEGMCRLLSGNVTPNDVVSTEIKESFFHPAIKNLTPDLFIEFFGKNGVISNPHRSLW